MFGWYTYTSVGEAEIVEILIFTETVDIYLNIASGVCDGIVHQVAEDRIEQWIITFDLYALFQRVDYCDMLFVEF